MNPFKKRKNQKIPVFYHTLKLQKLKISDSAQKSKRIKKIFDMCGLSGIFGDRKLEVAKQLPQHKCCGLRQFSILN